MKSKSIYVFFLFSFVLFSCRSTKYPSIEESEAKVRQYSAQNYTLDSSIKSLFIQEPLNRDAQIKLSKNLINSLLQKLTSAQEKDISFVFLASPKIYNEEKSVLGIKYSNYVDLKGGKLDVNIKTLKILDFYSDKLTAQIELAGKGNLEVNGQYMGVPASAKPDVEIYLNEKVTFLLKPNNKGNLILKPESQTLMLKIKIAVKLLGWAVPYYKEIPLNLLQLVQPIEIPLNFPMYCQLPKPSDTPGSNQFVFKPYTVDFSNSSINCSSKYIEYKSDINLLPNK